MPVSFFSFLSDISARFVFPQRCILCGDLSDSPVPLCASCADRRFFQPASRVSFTAEAPERCSRCGRPVISSAGLCTVCRALPLISRVDRIIPLAPYTGEAQELLTEWKGAGMRALSSVFAHVLSSALAVAFPGGCVPVVPVPPRPGKIRDRGWDQIEDLATLLERTYGLPLCRCLERTSLVQQKRLGRLERSINLKGRISAFPGTPVPRCAVVIDDLMTTGSTIDACAGALKDAGCEKVYALTLFYD
jgi:ComF family protein